MPKAASVSDQKREIKRRSRHGMLSVELSADIP
jgi:hypothetical protein